jgi:hypothetical protein
MPDGPWIWISWSESLLCPTVHESEALCQKVQYLTFWPRDSDSWTVGHNKLSDEGSFSPLKLRAYDLVRKFIMPDGPWIWSSLSESSVCPMIHESEALGQKVHYGRRSMNLQLFDWTFWQRASDSWTVGHNKLSDQELQIHGPSGIINFLTKRFRFMDRRAYWTFWPRVSDWISMPESSW